MKPLVLTKQVEAQLRFKRKKTRCLYPPSVFRLPACEADALVKNIYYSCTHACITADFMFVAQNSPNACIFRHNFPSTTTLLVIIPFLRNLSGRRRKTM